MHRERHPGRGELGRRRGPHRPGGDARVADPVGLSLLDDSSPRRTEERGRPRRRSGGDAFLRGGVFFEIPDEPEGRAAARKLAGVMYLRFADLPKRWIAGEEPRLDVHWARAAGMFSARVTVRPDELRRIQEELEMLLGPYLTRDPADAHSPAAAFAC